MLNNLLKLFVIQPNLNTNKDWKYPIHGQISPKYSQENAQSMLELSYKVSVHNRDGKINLNPPDFNIILPINCVYSYMNTNILWFFYSAKHNTVVLVFTATYNKILSFVDLKYFQTVPVMNNATDGLRIHGGFFDLYNRIRVHLFKLLNLYCDSLTQIIITGMSLGGATSTIAALDLFNTELENKTVLNNIVHYSFASPRLFNIIGALHYDKLNIPSHHIYNCSDIIPSVPFPIMPKLDSSEYFQHVTRQKYFDKNLESYYKNHIDAYLLEFNI